MFQNTQIAWMHEAVKEDANVKVIMRKNDTINITDAKTVIKSVYKPTKSDKVSIDIDELNFISFSKPWDWNKIQNKIYE